MWVLMREQDCKIEEEEEEAGRAVRLRTLERHTSMRGFAIEDSWPYVVEKTAGFYEKMQKH